MPVSAAQKTAIEEVVRALTSATSRRVKRRLADMFMELVDKDSWPEYYEAHIQLVFLNALYYNEPGSQIAKDATTLKGILESEWRQRSVLPAPPTSAPSSSAQKVHARKDQPERAAAQPPPATKARAATPARKSSRAPAAPPPTKVVEPTPQGSAQPAATARAKSPERAASPEIDVDVGGTPEPEVVGHDGARDGESDEIVRQLEKGLPRWEGLADAGWTDEVDADRMVDLVVTISKYRDESGNRLAASLEAVPEETNIPDLSFTFPLSLRLVESRTRMKYYETSKAFDRDMSQLFLKARRWYEIGTEPYGNVLVLQRLYHALTSPNPPQPPYTSTTGFAALPAGPGVAKPLHDSVESDNRVTTFRVSVKDRKIIDEIQYKGWTIRLADWLHLSNPDDPSRPIVGQVFKCFLYQENQKKGQPGVSVSWYYRPEQTFHPASRQFWEREVFKTSHFADHPIEDLVEKIACQFTARHLRGRPRPPFWHPGWPLYVCDARYNDRDRVFVKIKNWNSCIPEEVRKREEFMPIYPFERPVVPRTYPSPFAGAQKIKAPGGILDATEKADGEKTEAAAGVGSGAVTPAAATRKRPQRKAAAKAEAERASSVKAAAPPAQPTTQHAQYAQYAQLLPPQEDRSIYAAAGGVSALNNATAEELPPETARHFDRDPETNEVLWFAAPPSDLVHVPPPRHSLKYLAFLAKKRKREQRGAGPDAGGAIDVDADEALRPRKRMPPTVTEQLEALMREHGLDQVSVS
ncbi:Chromatin structure-remodeling complex subunit rsc1 [Trametes pubescens]|uniref:Chromatin structure-remodeling complex subunit rsc1 n=1 Tax=Trametes pubescens TaxID=154538 RepID=A0A1M2VLN6_TRAPU|nr:Chromatin structure-remodeling complex subunit rsc1 [Trametes pubescens]